MPSCKNCVPAVAVNPERHPGGNGDIDWESETEMRARRDACRETAVESPGGSARPESDAQTDASPPPAAVTRGLRLPFPGSVLLAPGPGRGEGPCRGRRRPACRQRWEEKVAAVAQSARVSATRDGLPVGQSQLRAPDQALGERTNKCSPAGIPALGVTTRGDSGRAPVLAPRAPFPAPQLRGGSPRIAPEFSAPGLGSWARGPPACPSRLPPRAASGPGARGPRARAPPSLSGACGEELFARPRAPGVTRRTALAGPRRLHLDLIPEPRRPQDDHAGRRSAQDDAAGPGAELPTQRVPAGR